MAEIQLPQLGESVAEGVITRWLVEVGDEVTVDQPIVEISTDKVDTEVPSPVAGTVTDIRFAVDDTVEVGQVIAVIGDTDAAPSDDADDAGDADASAPSSDSDDSDDSSQVAASEPAPAAAPAEDRAATPESGRVQRADEHDVDVIVLGGGTGGYS
ncbi:MAG: biotin/lipoyl-containing protein, partial [Nitriliruptoraceae bacterium]